MAQQRADISIPAEAYSSPGQAGGGGPGSVFGDLGGGQQQGSDLPPLQDGARNAYGHPTGNPSGGDGGISAAPAPGSVFGDLGGGVGSQLGGPDIPAAPTGSDPGGQGGR